jgi:hypothetical protein
VTFLFFFYFRKNGRFPFQKRHNKLDQLDVNWDEIEQHYTEVPPVSEPKPSDESKSQLPSEGSTTIASGSNANIVKPDDIRQWSAPNTYTIIKPDIT